MLSRFHLIPERYRQTDGQTDLLYQYRTDARYKLACFHQYFDSFRKKTLGYELGSTGTDVMSSHA